MQLDTIEFPCSRPTTSPEPSHWQRFETNGTDASQVQKIFFHYFFLWRVQSVAPTARRQTGNVSMLRGPRAGQSPEMADWGTSGKDGGEICRLQLLPPQPNVPWETGLHTQQCCGRENKKWGGGRVGCWRGHQPSTIFRFLSQASRPAIFISSDLSRESL